MAKRVNWTFEMCRDIALGCKTTTEFRKKYATVYGVSKRRGWYDEICSHMVVLFNSWTLEKCKEFALMYKSSGDWFKGEPKSYSAARKRGWMSDCQAHMTSKRTDWTFEMLRKEAIKYNTRSEFSKNSNGAYLKAMRTKVLDRICNHMFFAHESWTLEKCLANVPEYAVIDTWRHYNAKAYDVAIRKDWLTQCRQSLKSVSNMSLNDCIKHAARFKNLRGLVMSNKELYNHIVKNKFLDACIEKNERLKTITKDECAKVFNKFHKRQDLISSHRKLYGVAHHNGWIDELTVHMGRSWPLKYTLAELKADAEKYKTKIEWRTKSNKKYTAASHYGYMSQCSNHMGYALSGFDENKPAILYYIRIDDGNDIIYKIGITNRTLKERYTVFDMRKIITIKEWNYTNGKDAYDIEQYILKKFKADKYKGNVLLSRAKNTEMFNRDILGFDEAA